MISDYEKFNIIDCNGKKTGITVEVNWKPKDEESNECKILKITLPDGIRYYIPKTGFMSLLWAIGNSQEQMDMIPKKVRRVKWYETLLGITATKDIRKGEMINVPVRISLPTIGEEIIGEVKKYYKQKEKKTVSGIIVP